MQLLGLVMVALFGTTTPAHAAPPSGVFVTLASPTIDSTERLAHVDAIRSRLGSQFENKHVDLNITQLSVTYVGNTVEIVAEISFVVSGANDQIQSVGTQTTKLTVARRQCTPAKLQSLRKEVIDNAMDELARKLGRSHTA